MDWLTFVVELVKALVWPIAVVVLIFLLRKPVTSLLPELRHLRWREFHLDFEKKIGEIERQADKILPPPGEVSTSTKGTPLPEADRFSLLAEIAPSTAVMEAWLDVEMALRDAALRHRISATPATSAGVIAHGLAQQGKLDSLTVTLFNELRSLRNTVAHVPTTAITVSQAREFRDLATRLAAKLKSI